MIEYYDWGKTLSFASGADGVIVNTARGMGKTFGLRKQFIRDGKKDLRFVEVVRTKNELKGDAAIQHRYFDKLELDPDFEDLIFKVQGVHAFFADKPKKNKKPDWYLFGYFVAMTDEQQIKKRSNEFVNVKRILLDEAILSRTNPYIRYLPREYDIFAGIIDSVTRQRSDVQGITPQWYCLGNALDITNPYYIRYGITKEPKDGYTWLDNKHVLLHYIKGGEYSAEKATGTVAGRMLNGSVSGQQNIFNEFFTPNEHEIANKTPNAKLQFTIAYENKKYGVWLDLSQGYYYITGKAPDMQDVPIYALTNDDMKPNYIMIQMVRKQLQGIANLYYMGIIKYDNEQTRNAFLKVLSVLGIKYK